MAFISTHRNARISPLKVRQVANLIRNKPAQQAVTILELSKLRAAMLVKTTLLAAIANADQSEADVRRLKVTDARVDGGPTIKRFQPKDRGRAHAIKKRTSHITVGVAEA